MNNANVITQSTFLYRVYAAATEVELAFLNSCECGEPISEEVFDQFEALMRELISRVK